MSELTSNFYQQAVVEPLFATLANSSQAVSVRMRAATSLGELQDPNLSDRLATYLQGEDLALRLAVAKVLLRLDDRRGLKLLLENVLDDHGWIRRDVVEALGLYGGPATLPVLRWLQTNATWERDRARESVNEAVQRLA